MSSTSKAILTTELKAKVLEDKAAYRSHLAKLPILEKLRMLEEMRDTTRALKQVREENKAKIRATVASRAKDGSS